MRGMGSSTASSNKGIAAIVGVGPGLGRSIARKFAHEGYTVAILARDLGRLSKVAEEVAMEEKGQVYAIRIDCSESRSIREAFEGVLSLGFVEVLVYNACHHEAKGEGGVTWRPTSLIDIPVASFEKSLAVSAVGAFHCSQLVLPGMVERGQGTILFTGCSPSLNAHPSFLFSSLLWKVGIERVVAVSSKGVSASRNPRRSHPPRRRRITTIYCSHSQVSANSEQRIVPNQANYEPGSRELTRNRGACAGPRRGGKHILAPPHPKPLRLDTRDRSSSLPSHVFSSSSLHVLHHRS